MLKIKYTKTIDNLIRNVCFLDVDYVEVLKKIYIAFITNKEIVVNVESVEITLDKKFYKIFFEKLFNIDNFYLHLEYYSSYIFLICIIKLGLDKRLNKNDLHNEVLKELKMFESAKLKEPEFEIKINAIKLKTKFLKIIRSKNNIITISFNIDEEFDFEKLIFEKNDIITYKNNNMPLFFSIENTYYYKDELNDSIMIRGVLLNE